LAQRAFQFQTQGLGRHGSFERRIAVATGTHGIVFSTGEPAFAVDRHGSILPWNEAAATSLCYREAEALGSKCWQLVRGKDTFGNRYCCEHCPMMEMAVRHQSPYRCSMSLKTATGTLKRYKVSTLVLFDGHDGETLIHLCHAEPDGSTNTSGVSSDSNHDANSSLGILTPRELQVLQHLADGHATEDVATLLSISTATVRNHIEHLLHKLHAHSRLEAVAVARRLGLI
jgi:DNA-binding CsgD family transcriptional regulator